jgi:putative redox protein
MANSGFASAKTAQEHYKTEISAPSGVFISDEPLDLGGQNLGPSPNELMAAALASCTSITIRMIADRNGWDLKEVKTDVTFERNLESNATVFERKISLEGNLDDFQRKKLLSVANACPMHKVLNSAISVQSSLAE